MALEPSGDTEDPMCRSSPVAKTGSQSELSTKERPTADAEGHRSTVTLRPNEFQVGMTADSQQDSSGSDPTVIPRLQAAYLPQLGVNRDCLGFDGDDQVLLDKRPSFPCLSQSCHNVVVGSWTSGQSGVAAMPTSTLLSSVAADVDETGRNHSGRLSVTTTSSTSSLSSGSVRSGDCSSGASDSSARKTFASPSDSKHYRPLVDHSYSSASTATLPSRCPSATTSSAHSATVIPIGTKNLGEALLLSTSIPVSWPDQYRTTCIAAPPNKSVFDIDESCGGHRPHSNSFTLGQNCKLKRDALVGKVAQLQPAATQQRRHLHPRGLGPPWVTTEATGDSLSSSNSGGSSNTSTSTARSQLSERLGLVPLKKGKTGGGRLLTDCYSPAAQLKVAAKPTF